MTAPAQLTRIVALVAELSRRAEDGRGTPTLADLAAAFGVSAGQIAEDVQMVTVLGESADQDWTLSLQVWQQGEHLSLSSRGPFQRPIRLTPDEALALGIALLDAPGGPEIATRLAATGADPPPASAGGSGGDPMTRLSRATAERLVVAVRYVAADESEPVAWTLEPHQLVEWQGKDYVVAWCREIEERRHFRGDRFVEVHVLEERFVPRAEIEPVERPEDLFRPAPACVEEVRVRFTPAAARWARERWPGYQPLPDGSVEVVFRSASPDWLARRVLEFGAEAEVIAPELYRRFLRTSVS